MKDKLIQIKLIVLYVFKKVSKIKINLASAVHLACLGPNLFVFLILFFKYIQLIISSGLIVCVLSDLPTFITSLVL